MIVLKQNTSVCVALSHPLTLQNAGKEIHCAVSAVQRYNSVECLGAQFACFCDDEARDVDRETLVNRLICMTRIDSKMRQGWW